MENKRDIRIERLEKLKQATIINFTDRINYNNKLELYNTLLENVFNGNFDDMFLTKNLDGLSNEEKKNIFELARKYSSLCFFEGNSNYWLDSVEGVYLSDTDLVAYKLLDNYDFLLRVARECGEDSLKELVSFQEAKLSENQDIRIFDGKVVIDYLRGIFVDDDVLIDTIKDMTNSYKEFSTEQKAILCQYPEETLYSVKDDKNTEKISVDQLLRKIKFYFLGDDSDNYNLGDSLKHMKLRDFEDIIDNIYTGQDELISKK